MSLETPVGFFVFNRPDTTQRVFHEIARARPTTLLVVADGPRYDRPGEAERVAATRAIIDQVNWPCEVLTNYAEENLGCKRRVTSGLSWIFEAFEEAIILEDDCLPNPTFFTFCHDLLRRFRDDHRIVSISGSNFQSGKSRTQYSYYFSKYFHCYGWASWKRVWERFDPEMESWTGFQNEDCLAQLCDSRNEQSYWQRIFELQHGGQIDSWAYPWLYSCWTQNGLTAIPDVNLVSNIGFREDGTHTTTDSPLAALATKPIETIEHPRHLVRNKQADQYTFTRVYPRPRGLRKWARSIKKRWPTTRRRAA